MRPGQYVRGGMGLPAEEAHPAETSARLYQRDPRTLTRDEAAQLHREDPAAFADSLRHPSDNIRDDDDDMDEDEDPNMSMGFIGSLSPAVGGELAEICMQQLGSVGRSYRREKRGGFKR